jgi:hypothetical protein
MLIYGGVILIYIPERDSKISGTQLNVNTTKFINLTQKLNKDKTRNTTVHNKIVWEYFNI